MGLSSLSGGTARTHTLYHIIDASPLESPRKGDRRYGGFMKAECALAYLAEEMHMNIVVLSVVTVAATEFVSDPVPAILDDMDQVVLLESREASEYGGLVERV